MENSGMDSPPPFGPGSGMDPIPGSGMAGDPLIGSPGDPATPPMFNSPAGMFSSRSRRRGPGAPLAGHWRLRLALFLVVFAVFVAIAVFVVVQIASNQPPKAPSGQNFPALNSSSFSQSP